MSTVTICFTPLLREALVGTASTRNHINKNQFIRNHKNTSVPRAIFAESELCWTQQIAFVAAGQRCLCPPVNRGWATGLCKHDLKLPLLVLALKYATCSGYVKHLQ